MVHPYPPHDDALPYTGTHRYFLTFCTDSRRCCFEDSGKVDLVTTQFLRAASKWRFEITAYCFMPEAGIVRHPSGFPHLGSSRYSVGELLEMCEYERYADRQPQPSG
jgi:hypothetical protein